MNMDFKTLPNPPGRIYAIGDIHGCAQELDVLLNYLEFDEQLSSYDLPIFIGDYVDRGDYSKEVISALIAFRQRHPQALFLRGNHEVMLMDFLGMGGDRAELYIPNGGLKTLESYGVPRNEMIGEAGKYFPAEHIQFLESLERYVVMDPFVFVHAGLHPLRPLEEQTDSHIYWIRDEFIQNIHRFDKTIVFGHTPVEDVWFNLPYKIAIDTGLVYGNMLSCVDLTDNRVLQVKFDSRKVIVRDA